MTPIVVTYARSVLFNWPFDPAFPLSMHVYARARAHMCDYFTFVFCFAHWCGMVTEIGVVIGWCGGYFVYYVSTDLRLLSVFITFPLVTQ